MQAALKKRLEQSTASVAAAGKVVVDAAVAALSSKTGRRFHIEKEQKNSTESFLLVKEKLFHFIPDWVWQ